ncbi:hypothetical protein BY996DRAFT_6412286 [Phakopsora pachyrhizi]|nr:hypothetical protein BY996DRAFT_6412286 [Phakopsora pachyrhizi]
MYTKPQGTLPEANISLLALRTSAVKSSRWYAFLRGGGSQANSLADRFWGHLPGRLFRDGLQDKPQGLFPEAEKLDLQGRVVCKAVICCAVHTVLRLLLLHTAAVAQYEKGVSCNP